MANQPQRNRNPQPTARRPYDTLEEVIGLRSKPGHGSLAEWGVKYSELALADDGGLDWEALEAAVQPGGWLLGSRAAELECSLVGIRTAKLEGVLEGPG